MEGSPAVEREHSLCRGRRAENEEGAQGWWRRPGPEPRWLDGSSLENLNTLPPLQARLVRGWRREPVSPGPALTGACHGRSVAGQGGQAPHSNGPQRQAEERMPKGTTGGGESTLEAGERG